MTKISNEDVYISEEPISELDYVIGTDGNSPARRTKSFSFGNIRSFTNAGLSPIFGGTLAITEYLYIGPLTTPQDVVNQLFPNKTIMPYEVFVVNVNGEKYITKVQDRVVGDTQPPTVGGDYILLSTVDATTTNRGKLKLAGDLGGTADSPTTPTAIHTTGNEVKVGSLTVTSIIKSGGLASQFLKADGTVDSNVYAIDSGLIHTTGNEVKTGTLTVSAIIKSSGLASQFLKADGTVDSNVYAIDSGLIHTTGNEVKTGSLTVTSIIKSGGTALQYLMADGSIKAVKNQKVITASTVLADADDESVIFINNGATPITITINASVTVSGFCVGFIQEGTADVTYVGTGVSLTNPIGLKGKGQGYQTFIERKLATTTFYLIGNTKA
jgi:hypothetical protein